MELTRLMAEERKLSVDMEAYEEAKLQAQVSTWGVGLGPSKGRNDAKGSLLWVGI